MKQSSYFMSHVLGMVYVISGQDVGAAQLVRAILLRSMFAYCNGSPMLCSGQNLVSFFFQLVSF